MLECLIFFFIKEKYSKAQTYKTKKLRKDISGLY